jgi:hypothetical protein
VVPKSKAVFVGEKETIFGNQRLGSPGASEK